MKAFVIDRGGFLYCLFLVKIFSSFYIFAYSLQRFKLYKNFSVFNINFKLHHVRCFITDGFKLCPFFLIYLFLQTLLARAYETLIVLGLLAVVVLGMTYVISALLDSEQSNIHTLLSELKCLYTDMHCF